MTATVHLGPFPIFQAFNENGDPLAGGKLYTYQANSATPLVTYSDAGGSSQNTNPVILDANGKANVYFLPQAYKLNLTDSSDVQQVKWPVDNFYTDLGALADTSNVSLGDALVGVKNPETGGVARTQHDKNLEIVSVKDFGAVGDGVTDDSAAFTAAIAAAIANGGLRIYCPAGTYIKNTSHVIDGDNVYLEGDGPEATIIKRNDATSGYLFQWGNSVSTTGGGISNMTLYGVATTVAGNAGLGFGGSTFYANKFTVQNVICRNWSQYGCQIFNGSYFTISNLRIEDHGLTSGSISSCIGFGIFPRLASTGGQLNNVYSAISSNCKANASANTAAIKIQCHQNLTATNLTGVWGSEECMSIDSIDGIISNIRLTQQDANTALNIGNNNTAHNFSGQVFILDNIIISGTSNNSITLSGGAAVTLTAVDTTADTVTSTAHGFTTGMPVAYQTTGTQIGGLVQDQLLYVLNPTTDTFQLSKTLAGSAIDLTSAGSGTQTIQPVKLAGCKISNVKAHDVRFLNNGVYKNCTFTDWDVDSIILDWTAAGVTVPSAKNTNNIHRGVGSNNNASTNRCIFNAARSKFTQCGIRELYGFSGAHLAQITGASNTIVGLFGKFCTSYTDLASVSAASSTAVSISGTSTSGFAFGDFLIPSCDVDTQGMLLTAHYSSSTSLNIRVTNKTAGAIDLDMARWAARRIYKDEQKLWAVKTSWQPQGTNLANAAQVSTTVTVQGAALGDVACMAWKSTTATLCPFAYVSAANTVTAVLLNESGGASSAATATSDLNVCVLKDTAADYSNQIAYDPPSLTNGSLSSAQTITVNGASLGDFVAVSFSLDTQGIWFFGYVSAADTVTVYLWNRSGGTLDLSAGTLKALVFKAE